MSKFYAVARGRQPGIYSSWDEAKAQVNGYPRALYKSFKTQTDAEAFINSATTEPTTITSVNKVILYTDGSCDNRYGGCGILIKLLDGKIEEYSVPLSEYPTTNVRAELYAIYYGLDFVKQLNVGQTSGIQVDVYTDSSYSIDEVTYRKAGIIHEVNADLTTAIVEVGKLFNNVIYHHVYGHQSDVLNNRVDILAGIASSQAPQIVKK